MVPCKKQKKKKRKRKTLGSFIIATTCCLVTDKRISDLTGMIMMFVRLV